MENRNSAVKAEQDLHHTFLGVNERVSAGEHVGQHVFGDLRASDAQGVAGVLHFAQALSQRVELLGHLVRARVPDVGETVVDLPEELAQLEGRVDVAVAHAANAHPHQLPGQVSHAEQVVCGRHLEGENLSSHWQV